MNTNKTKISSQREFDNLPNGERLWLKKEGYAWPDHGAVIEVIKNDKDIYEAKDPSKVYRFNLMTSDMSNQMWWDEDFMLYASLNYD